MGNTQSNCDTKESNIMESDEECFHDAEDGPTTEEIFEYNNLAQFQMDAVKSKRPNIFSPSITYETMRDIENELSFYEKVSLVFLIFDQEDIALQNLLVEKDNLIHQTTTNLLVKWARSDTAWKKKVIEGLCIIQNYCILERLGYNKDELKASHLPTIAYTANNINILNKAFYLFAESLTIDQIKLFLKLLEKDFREKGLLFLEFDDLYVEMFLLQCFSVKYIDRNNISNIITILEKMKLYEQVEMLQTAFRMRNNAICETDQNNMRQSDPIIESKHTVCNFDLNSKFNNTGNTPIPGSCSDHSVISRSSLVKTYPSDEDRYKIDPDNVGICLIINQYEFYEDQTHPHSMLAPSYPLENRKGTEFDRDRLKETFAKYNFRIIVRENRTDTEIREVVQDAMKKFSKKDSCFVVCILSHGEQDTVFGVNSIPVGISELEDMLHDTKYPNLLGKPKILIIQSCQGKRLQKVISTEPNYTTDGVSENTPSSSLTSTKLSKIVADGLGVPQRRDLLILLSTVPGYASIRDPSNGTWFIQEFCNIFEECSDDKHMEEIMTRTTAKVSAKIWPKDNELYTMVPRKIGSLSKDLFLKKVQN